MKRNKFGRGMRIACALLCVAILMCTCIGCSSYATDDDVSALKNRVDKQDSANEEYTAALEELVLLKSSYEQTKAELEALKTAHSTTQGELDLLESKHKATEQKITSLSEENTAAKQEINTLKNDYQAAQQQISDLETQIEDLIEEIGSTADDGKIRIYIDQGHNPTSYHNTGASGNGYYEQDITYTVGVLLAELLENDGRFVVCLSRPTATTVLGTDYDSSLDARVEGAKKFRADYFISIHANSHDDNTVRGTEVYVLEAGSVSYSFGNCLLQGILGTTNLNNRGMKTGMEFRVIKNATMPAALVEMAFISNKDDAILLGTRPDLFAQGLYNGILSYFQLESNSTPTT